MFLWLCSWTSLHLLLCVVLGSCLEFVIGCIWDTLFTYCTRNWWYVGISTSAEACFMACWAASSARRIFSRSAFLMNLPSELRRLASAAFFILRYFIFLSNHDTSATGVGTFGTYLGPWRWGVLAILLARLLRYLSNAILRASVWSTRTVLFTTGGAGAGDGDRDGIWISLAILRAAGGGLISGTDCSTHLASAVDAWSARRRASFSLSRSVRVWRKVASASKRVGMWGLISTWTNQQVRKKSLAVISTPKSY